jgi:hypothetical protein
VLRRSFIWFVCLFVVAVASGQPVTITGRFSTDSVKLGEPIFYSLSVKYPRHWQVLLPDSTFNFSPFEFQKKIFFQTHTRQDISFDSVVYRLATYEVDSIQTLKLPAFVVQARDCTVYESHADTVYFKHLVAHVPDSLAAEQLPLKANTNYNPVSWMFNYPLFSIAAASLLVVAVVIWLVFGKKIRKYFLIRRLSKKHREFIERFDQAMEKMKTGFSAEMAERSVVLWKKYMEDLLARPYTKYTTRELRALEKDDALNASLHAIDRAIYGHIPLPSLDSFQQLKVYSQNQFSRKLEALQV